MNHPESGLNDPTCKECAELRAEIKRLQLAVVDLDRKIFVLKYQKSDEQIKHAVTINQARKAVENDNG
jgi:hypothetical protein